VSDTGEPQQLVLVLSAQRNGLCQGWINLAHDKDQWGRAILKAVKKFPVLKSAIVVLSSSLSYCPAVCRIVQQPVVLSISLSYCPAVCRIVQQSVVLSSSLSYCPVACRIVRQPVVLSISLTYCPAACRIVHQPVVLSSSLSYCPAA